MLAQQNLTSPSATDENRRLRMLLNNRNMTLGKDGLTNSVGDVVSNVGSPLQAGGPLLARGDTEMMIKVLLSLSITLPSAVIVVPMLVVAIVIICFLALPALRCYFHLFTINIMVYLLLKVFVSIVKNGSATAPTAATEQ